jgi:hypothetical protein
MRITPMHNLFTPHFLLDVKRIIKLPFALDLRFELPLLFFDDTWKIVSVSVLLHCTSRGLRLERLENKAVDETLMAHRNI